MRRGGAGAPVAVPDSTGRMEDLRERPSRVAGRSFWDEADPGAPSCNAPGIVVYGG